MGCRAQEACTEWFDAGAEMVKNKIRGGWTTRVINDEAQIFTQNGLAPS
jgi:hypothetical protein